jgi:SAM-dependent methyltransferase
MQMVIFKREAMEMAGLVDYGFFHDAADNDLTFRTRRAGYRTVLCKDTFVHHDHVRINLSEKELERFNHSIDAGRKDFQSKYFGIDAWEDVNNYETVMISLVNPQERKGSKGLEILGVDVLCGTPILELKNKLREARVFDARLSAFSTDPKYWLDLKTICAGKVVIDRIEFMNEHFADERFDYVVLGQPINAYQNPLELLQDLLKKLKDDGHLLIKLHNTYDVVSLYKTLGAKVHVNNQLNNAYQLSTDELVSQIKNAGFVYKKLAVENWPLGERDQIILRNAKTATDFSNNPEEIFARAVVQNYVIDIARE